LQFYTPKIVKIGGHITGVFFCETQNAKKLSISFSRGSAATYFRCYTPFCWKFNRLSSG